MCDSESGIERWPNLRGKIAIRPELDLNKGLIRLNVRRILIPHSLLAATRPGEIRGHVPKMPRDNRTRQQTATCRPMSRTQSSCCHCSIPQIGILAHSWKHVSSRSVDLLPASDNLRTCR